MRSGFYSNRNGDFRGCGHTIVLGRWQFVAVTGELALSAKASLREAAAFLLPENPAQLVLTAWIFPDEGSTQSALRLLRVFKLLRAWKMAMRKLRSHVGCRKTCIPSR